MFILTKESFIVTCSEFMHHSSNRKKCLMDQLQIKIFSTSFKGMIISIKEKYLWYTCKRKVTTFFYTIYLDLSSKFNFICVHCASTVWAFQSMEKIILRKLQYMYKISYMNLLVAHFYSSFMRTILSWVWKNTDITWNVMVFQCYIIFLLIYCNYHMYILPQILNG